MSKTKSGWKTLGLVFVAGLTGMILGLIFDYIMLIGVDRLARAFPRGQVTVAFAGAQAAASSTSASPYVLLIVAVLLPVIALFGLPLWWYLAHRWQASPTFARTRPARVGIVFAAALIPAFLVLQEPVTVESFKASAMMLVNDHIIPAFLFIVPATVITCVAFACLAGRAAYRAEKAAHPEMPRRRCARSLAVVLPAVVVLFAIWDVSLRWYG